MKPFRSEWGSWKPPVNLKTCGNGGAKSAKSPSDTFGTATSEETYKLLEDRKIECVNRFYPWDCEYIWNSLLAGHTVTIWASVLNEWVIWVFEERQRESLCLARPATVVYTWPEIKLLIEDNVTQEGLKVLHEAKRILGGRFI